MAYLSTGDAYSDLKNKIAVQSSPSWIDRLKNVLSSAVGKGKEIVSGVKTEISKEAHEVLHAPKIVQTTPTTFFKPSAPTGDKIFGVPKTAVYVGGAVLAVYLISKKL